MTTSDQIIKGIVLAGGRGSRLYPATRTACKQLLPVYDKPLLYYPLSTLMLLGVRDILIISAPDDKAKFQALFGDGSKLGIDLSYEEQPQPGGIAQALMIGERFIDNDNIALILGDNIFCDVRDIRTGLDSYDGGGMVFGCRVDDPHRFGVAEFDAGGRLLAIEEKPASPKSSYAIVGLYFYDLHAVEMARSLRPSQRGELEISALNQAYLGAGRLQLVKLREGAGWFDVGTARSMLEAGNRIASVEITTKKKIGCVEEVAYRQGLIGPKQLRSLINDVPDNRYREYLVGVLRRRSG